MATENKLLQSIIRAGREEAAVIEKQAEDSASALIKEAERSALKQAEEIKAVAEKKAESIKNTALSSVSLLSRGAILNAKRAEISKTLNGIVEYINSLSDSAYFDLLYKIAKQLENAEGTVLLNKKDLERLPDDFCKKMANSGIKCTVAKEPVDIPCGFILRLGEIEVNCSAGALLEEKRNELEDYINSALFVQEDC